MLISTIIRYEFWNKKKNQKHYLLLRFHIMDEETKHWSLVTYHSKTHVGAKSVVLLLKHEHPYGEDEGREQVQASASPLRYFWEEDLGP